MGTFKHAHERAGTALERVSNAGVVGGAASRGCGTGQSSSETRCSLHTSHPFETHPDRLLEMAKVLRGRMLGVWQLEVAVDR